jgi:spermidine synthase
LDDLSLRSVVRTFLELFPESQAWLLRWSVDAPVLGLVGFTDPAPLGDGWVESRLGYLPLQTELRRLALADSVRFFGHAVTDARGLRRYAGNAPLNTDDRPVVTFAAPRLGSQPQRAPYGQLFHLLNAARIAAKQPGIQTTEFAARLNAFRVARDVHLRGLAAEIDGRQAEAIDAFVESARLSPDFTAGYARCLTIAAVLREAQPAAARRLLERLAEAQPALPVARQMLERLERETP